MEPNAPPRRRPYDSLSLPAVPGQTPGDYQQPFGAQQQPDYGYSPHEADPYLGNGPTVASSPPSPPAVPPIMPAYPQPAPSVVPDGPYIPPAPYSQQPGPPMPQPQPGYQNEQYGPQPMVGLKGVLLVDGASRRYELHPGSNFIGRGSDSDLQLLDQGVSRRHLDIQFDGSFATAYDLGSTNGTNVNGHDIKSQLLRHGDVVRVGHTRLVFQQEHG